MSKKHTPEGWPDNVGRHGRLTSPKKHVSHFEILDEIRRPHTGLDSKIIYLQKIRFEDGRIELRLCYYIIGKVGRAKGKWVFGQFATLLPIEDFQAIIA